MSTSTQTATATSARPGRAPDPLLSTRDECDGERTPPRALIGVPWRVALALQGDGWLLRNDVIWR